MTDAHVVLPFRRGRVDDDGLTAFFTAANRLYLTEPWETAHDSHVFAVDAAGFGWLPGACACLIGEVGEHPGVLVFGSLQDYLVFIEEAEKARKIDEPPLAPCPVFSINFDPKHEAPRDRVKRAKAAGLRPARAQAFPWIQRFAASNVPVEVEAADYAFATALLESLAAMIEAHDDLFLRMGLDPPLVSDGPVRVTAPHPDVPWAWGETALEYYRWWEADEVRDRFIAATASAERTPQEEEARAEAVAVLFRCKIEHQGVEPLDFAHDDMEELLLEYVPESEVIADEHLPKLPDRIIEFIRWLGDEKSLDAELVDTLCEDADRLRDTFLEHARDPERFGPEKQLVVAMEAAGIDTEDEAAITRFMEEYVPKATDAAEYEDLDDADEVPRVAEKKWTWTPGEPAPDPKAPCPCGSGKRYKKCCMPR
jgi:hypothetical protein